MSTLETGTNDLLATLDDGILTLTLNRPEARNAMSADMNAALQAQLARAEFDPAVFWVEDGVIWKAVRSMIYREMQVRDVRINFEAVLSVKDKGTRGRSFQRRMRAGQCRFDKRAEWYPGFEQENLRFTGTSQATLDDQFDSAALLSRGFDEFSQVEESDFFDEEDWEMERGFWNRKALNGGDGRSSVTGY
jgi:hypothetical protein